MGNMRQLTLTFNGTIARDSKQAAEPTIPKKCSTRLVENADIEDAEAPQHKRQRLESPLQSAPSMRGDIAGRSTE